MRCTRRHHGHCYRKAVQPVTDGKWTPPNGTYSHSDVLKFSHGTVKVKRRFACVVAVAAALCATAGSNPVRGQAPRPVASHPAASSASSSAPPADPSAQRALVDKYCVSCHNARLKTGGLVLDKDAVNLARVPDRADIWEKVIRKLHGRMMPPQGMPRPDEATLDAFAASLETTIDRATLAKPNPGRSPLHRLNRSEYAAAVHDLLALDIDATALLPADDEANGFDNIADVLKVSPSLLEQYLTAARKVSTLAVGDPRTTTIGTVYRVPPDRSQEDHIEGLPLGTRGGALVRHDFPVDATYEVNVVLLQNIVGYVPGLEWPHELEISIDGQRVFLAEVGGTQDNKLSDTNLALTKETLDRRLRTRVAVKAGPHDVGVTFLRKNSALSDEPLQPFTRNLDLQDMNGVPTINFFQITGPFNVTGPGDTPSRRKIFLCHDDGTTCARRVLSTVARRAYRRPVTQAEVDELLRFYQAGRKDGTFDAGIQESLAFVLASPKFLFRAEPDPPQAAVGVPYPVSDLELASRLSFFLWSTIPDDDLLNAAAQGRLHEPTTLERQVRRMLADPKSNALVDNFAAQWLFLRNLQSFIPDSDEFPNWDDNLRQAMRTETSLFFDSIMRGDRSVLDLLTADYTFVNERLARHYGIPNVYGSQFRRVTVADENRRGLLGQGSVLAVTSYPNRTSVVLRGKYILENILGTPPPAPPANTPPLKETGEGGKELPLRALMEQHRKSPTCATCHRVIDPLGFSLENFDATGKWRVKTTTGPVDASGQLADGTPVDGPVALRKAILKHPEQFVRTMTEKMLTYALGRGLEYYDMPVVRDIAADAKSQNYRFSSIVLGIVKSTPFMQKMKASGNSQVATNNSHSKF
jgi:mono/diheme cytochrome c family protein